MKAKTKTPGVLPGASFQAFRPKDFLGRESIKAYSPEKVKLLPSRYPYAQAEPNAPRLRGGSYPMAQMNVIVEFYTLNCFECGGLFAVTLKHFTNHKKYGRAVCCPSCKHENFYLSDEERDKDEKDAADLATARAEIVALKSRVVELRHLIEQAEARQQPKEPTTPGAVQPNADDARPVLRRTASGRWCCPHCTATFKKCVSAQFFRHLRRKHDDDVTPGLLDTGGVDRFQVLPAVATAGGAL